MGWRRRREGFAMHRWLAAPIVAAIVALAIAAPGAAQSCADFPTQKEAEFALGVACDPALFAPPPTGDIAANVDGPVAGDSASGLSGEQDLTTTTTVGQTVTTDQAGADNSSTVTDTSAQTTQATDPAAGAPVPEAAPPSGEAVG